MFVEAVTPMGRRSGPGFARATLFKKWKRGTAQGQIEFPLGATQQWRAAAAASQNALADRMVLRRARKSLTAQRAGFNYTNRELPCSSPATELPHPQPTSAPLACQELPAHSGFPNHAPSPPATP